MKLRFSLAVGGLLWPLLLAGQPVLQREPNTSLKLPQNPPSFGFTTARAFGSLTFTNPVALAVPPGETNRLFVVEQAGIVAAITNLANPSRTVFLDIRSRVTSGGERGLLGLAFHPDFATNRQFFVFYTPTTSSPAGNGLHNRLSRFLATPDSAWAEEASELVFISQLDEASNHNGGDLHFGPDGYLYASLGDEGGANDTYNNSTRIDKDFFSAILRLDVDGRPGSLHPNPHWANTNAQGQIQYRIPADNPFIGVTNHLSAPVLPQRVRTEFWAVGLRNPWRMAFDRESGLLYAGDVGQDRWEEINIIKPGLNYGWSFREGNASGPRANPPAGATFEPPILAYGHGSATNQGFSVTGGIVYQGDRFPALFGSYIFADYVSGNIWATRYTGTNNPRFSRIAGDTGIAGFGIDPRNGDVLMADQDQDTVKRLVHNSVPVGEPLPTTLADTGAFKDLISLEPETGIVAYEVNTPFWSDGATKQRWFSLPDTNLVFGFAPNANWLLPTGAVWIKHFELELTNGLPESRRRLETRFMVRNPSGGYGVAYRWDDSQTNAFLVPDEGLDETFTVFREGQDRTQTWHYPSRSECLSCHTPQGGFALSFNTAQLNREHMFPGGATNQLVALTHAGFLNPPPPAPETLPAMAALSDTNASVSLRVRSYIAANCAQCHQAGGSVGFWDGRYADPPDLSKIINVPLNDPQGSSDNRVVRPGSISHSELLRRISFRGPGQMPPIASSEIDHSAVSLISTWITNTLRDYTAPSQSYSDWAHARFGDAAQPRAASRADPDQDGLRNFAEYLYERDPLDALSHWRIKGVRSDEGLVLRFPRVLNRGGEIRLESAPVLEGPWLTLDLPPETFFSPEPGENQLIFPISEDRFFWRSRILDP